MAKSSIRSVGDNIIHVVASRVRVRGTGYLRLSLHSLDDINTSTLHPIEMSSSTNKPATKLANFRDSRVQLKIITNDIDEVFNIGTFYMFTKPVAESYPVI